MQRRNKKYQIQQILVPNAGDTVRLEFSVETGAERVTGLALTTPTGVAVQGSVFKEFRIDSEEVFPEGMEVKFLMTGLDISTNDRFYTVDEKGDKSTVKVTYTDGGNAPAYPYTAILYLRLENRGMKTVNGTEEV